MKTSFLHNAEIFETLPPDLFAPRDARPLGAGAGVGRGSAVAFEINGAQYVLKHYERGGYPRRFIKDTYAFLGLERTRMWREFRLLARLHELGLPVPRPVAARCVFRSPLTYRGDLVTERLPQTRTLADAVEATALEETTWRAVGEAIARFHRENVFHADLNARNIMLNEAGDVFLIDFDKSAVRPVGKAKWSHANLQRLLRSLRKHQRLSGRSSFRERNWQDLERGYESALKAGF
ncbi:MAG: 3-deoxy-D-manno-octulosonic acid kinase [Opitutales bacterium]